MTPAAWRAKTKKTLEEVATLLREAGAEDVSSLSTVRRYERGEREAPTSVSLAYRSISSRLVTAEDVDSVRKAWLLAEADRVAAVARKTARARSAARKTNRKTV